MVIQHNAFVACILCVLAGCSSAPAYEYKPIQVDYTASREREKRGRLLLEKISECQGAAIRRMIKTPLTPNQVVDKAEEQCSAEREAWVSNEAGGAITPAMARNALDSGTCSRSIWTRYISLVRGGASTAEIRAFTSTFQCS